MVSLTMERAKELEALLNENGFEEIAGEIPKAYHNTKGYLYLQYACDHEYMDLKSVALKSYGSMQRVQEAGKDTICTLYAKLATCKHCGRPLIKEKSEILDELEAFDDQYSIKISNGCSKWRHHQNV